MPEVELVGVDMWPLKWPKWQLKPIHWHPIRKVFAGSLGGCIMSFEIIELDALTS